jgi:5-methyltetrahydropteroyltriglutamate--homocysteine methyltransferase
MSVDAGEFCPPTGSLLAPHACTMAPGLRRSGWILGKRGEVGMNYRADTVGSMLRPTELLEAREQHDAGMLDEPAFKKVEDRAVDYCIEVQEQAGIDVITDGEMRRNVFASQLVQASEGFERIEHNYVDWYDMDGNVQRDPVTVGLTGKIRMKRRLSDEEFTYLRAKTERLTKMTIPSPTMYAYYWVPGVSEAAYPNPAAYMADVTGILRDEVEELVRLGATYIQFDAPEFGMILDPHQQEWFRQKGFAVDYMIEDGIDMINAIIDGFDARGVTFGLHICRGNDANRYMASGGYDLIARKVFQRCNVARLLLEYDDARSGGFEPLAEVPEDKLVVLGLISTKRSEVESADEITARIHDAARYIPLERLALSPQCGFASVAKGNHLTFDHQAAKLALTATVARRVWDD